MTVLLDTSFLIALTHRRDSHHVQARSAMRELTAIRIVVAPVLPESFYMATTRINYASAHRLFDLIRTSAFQIEPLWDDDMARMSEIMRQYHDNAFDYVDTAIMAVSERLGIIDVYTFDRRDFSVFRPKHCAALTLLPAHPGIRN
jgi:predicted nucleic acid-binding protein